MREDEPAPQLTPEEALQNAPDEDRDCFRVPRVIE
jgi:Asp-tRNA(Asn)/Glu-tRNA(Gln) amidotransferase C subunit